MSNGIELLWWLASLGMFVAGAYSGYHRGWTDGHKQGYAEGWCDAPDPNSDLTPEPKQQDQENATY